MDTNGAIVQKQLTIIQKSFKSNIVKIACERILVSNGQQVEAFDFSGSLMGKWHFNEPVTHLKVHGGRIRREAVLVALKDGSLIQIFVSDLFQIPLLKHDLGIKSLQLSYGTHKIGLIDDQRSLACYDFKSKKKISTELNVRSFAWNSLISNLICFSDGIIIYVKIGEAIIATRQFDGEVMGFRGCEISCIDKFGVYQVINVSLSSTIDKLLKDGELKDAYDTACFGATEIQWRKIASQSLLCVQSDLALSCYAKIYDFAMMQGIEQIERLHSDENTSSDSYLAGVQALNGNFKEVVYI